MPEKPWQDLALDLMGPMPTGEYLVVLIDYYSRWIEVDVSRSTTSETIIKMLDAHFVRYGIPKTLRTDNGANLVSAEIESYLTEMGVYHKLTTPLWPSANGEVERQNQSLLKAMRAAHAEKKNWRTELNKYLLAYRSTTHMTTGRSPAELLFGRSLGTKLPDIGERGDSVDCRDQPARDHDAEKKNNVPLTTQTREAMQQKESWKLGTWYFWRREEKISYLLLMRASPTRWQHAMEIKRSSSHNKGSNTSATLNI